MESTVLGFLTSDWTGAVSLSTKGLLNVRWELLPKDFEFVVGAKSYSCPCIIAEFLSPKVSQMRLLDPTATKYVVRTKDPKNLFPSLIEMAKGQKVNATNESLSFYITVIKELGNFDEITEILKLVMDVRELNAGNALDQMLLREELTGSMAEKELEFIASHLYEVQDSSLIKLSYDVMDAILSHPNLKVNNEDELYELVCKFIAKDSSYVGLLQHIRFEFLSEGVMTSFVQNQEMVIEFMNIGIWKAISRRLVLKPQITMSARAKERYCRLPGVEFPVNRSKPLSGIIAHLTQKIGGNPALNGTVVITSNNNFDSSEPVTNLLGLSERTLWHASRRMPDTSFQIDFKTRRVIPTGYSISTNYGSCTGYNLRNWVVEVSDDGTDWTTVDTRNDDLALQENSTTGTFNIAKHVECQYIRVRQTGKNHDGHTELYVHAFELFGTLIE